MLKNQRFKSRKLISLLMIFGISLCALTASAETDNRTASELQSSGKLISGIVKDDQGERIVGATVRVKGVAGGTITDIDGVFSIKTNDPNATLLISFIGMKDVEVPLNGQSQVEVTMEYTAEAIEELVVVGYGVQKKESVVAAISSISAQEIVSTPTSNIVSGLAGKMPGLTIMIQDGELGAENIQTLIRGQATMNNSAPLILVDGVERALNDIDPYDVETVNILKDASATAVFGVRGANGVILVTTKKGIEGKAKVTANLNYSVQNTTSRPEPLNAMDYMTLSNQVMDMENARLQAIADAENRPYTPADRPYDEVVLQRYRDNVLPEYYVDRNFQEEFIRRNVPMIKGNVNIRGGNEKTKYFASAGYTRQGGPYKTERWDEYNYDNEERLDRFTYRANIDMNITKSLRGWVNLSGSLQDKNDPVLYVDQRGVFASSYLYLMAELVDNPSVSHPDLSPDGLVVGMADGDRTPYAMLNRSGYKTKTTNNINSTVGFEQKLDKITQGLSLKAKISYDSNVSHSRGFSREYTTYVRELVQKPDGSLDVDYTFDQDHDTNLTPRIQQSMTERTNFELSSNYNRKFNKKHDVSGLFLFMRNKRVLNNKIPFNYVGLVGRATYGYKSKYLAEFNFGMNGSEQFAKGKRFGFFPSASAGWVLSEENFIKNISRIDFLKIRASYGQVGNDKISNKPDADKNRFLYVPSWVEKNGKVYQEFVHNPDVTWEVANKFNVGLETRFLDGFEYDLDVFYEKRNSILIESTSVPEMMSGQSSLPPVNEGIMSNRGFETKLGYTKKINNDLTLGGALSVSYAHNIVEYVNEKPFDESYATRYRKEGYSRGTSFGYDCLGYYKDQADIDNSPDATGLVSVISPGDLKYRDVNGDGEISEKDMIAMSYPSIPEYNYSLSIFGNYKNFDFNILFNAVSNYSYNISGRGVYDLGGNDVGGKYNYFSHHLNAWTPERAETGDFWYPRMYPDLQSVSKQPSNFWTIDTKYLRLKNLEIGYTIPKLTLNKIGISKIRLFVTGSNLFMWHNLPVETIDPETKNSLSHPIYSTLNFGANISF